MKVGQYIIHRYKLFTTYLRQFIATGLIYDTIVHYFLLERSFAFNRHLLAIYQHVAKIYIRDI